MFSASPPTHNASIRPSPTLRASLSSNFISPFVGDSVCGDFSGHKIRPQSLTSANPSSSRPKRDVVTMVIPFSRGSALEQPPPNVASYLLQQRIVYLGMVLLPPVTRLILAEFLYLQHEDEKKPIYLYINSTGTMKGDRAYGHEREALAIYDIMSYIKTPVFTLCAGNAWGDAALLLAAGARGNRAALPSASIMIREPMARFQGQATDVDIARKEIKNLKAELVEVLSRHTGKPPEVIEADIRRPKYFSPSEAVEYGIIDKVLYKEKSPRGQGTGYNVECVTAYVDT